MVAARARKLLTTGPAAGLESGAVGTGLLSVLFVLPTALSAEEPRHEAYQALVERSCTKNDAAVRALSDWSPEDIEGAVQKLHECERWRTTQGESLGPSGSPEEDPCGKAVPWAAAAALHTSRALTWPAGSESLFHLSVAEAQQELLTDDAFRRRWYLTAGLGCLYLLDFGSARSYLMRGLEQFEGDPALLVALGASHEAEARRRGLAARGAGSGRPSRVLDRAPEGTERLRSLQEAVDLYERALSDDPELPEAHLRLGRVQLLLGRPDEGLANLRWVTDHGRARDLVYLAHLFIGRESMQSGELDAALVSYRAAREADPRGQAAYVATSHALQLSGDPVAAAEVFEQGLAARRRTRASDAWWRYPEGRKGQLPALLKRLRQEACQ